MRPQEGDPGVLTVTLRHAKHNDGPKAPPTGVTFTFDPDGRFVITRASADPTSLTLSQRILNALRDGRETLIAPLAAELGEKYGSVNTALDRLEGHNKVLRLPGPKPRQTLWRRADG